MIAAAGGYAHADAGANGYATDSPGVLSGNSVQAPINVPVNVCGNTVDVVGALNPTFGNSCVNKGGGAPRADTASTGAAPATPGAMAGTRAGTRAQATTAATPEDTTAATTAVTAATTAVTAATTVVTAAPGVRRPAATRADRRASAPATTSRRRSTCR